MTPPPALLLDTCAIIWLFNGDKLTRQAERAIVDAGLAGGILISPVSGWEIGMLSRPRAGRANPLVFLPDPKTWFRRATARPGVRLAPFCSDIAVDAAFLPEPLHVDAADRLLIATARHLGATIATRDARILAYGEAGHVSVLAC
ncbi:MAG: type II toxin-antitoxin system VapC family toxin [Acetobacteraceae bacterium]|nr:type II toxin-antitoxin system VapC family toxin [Acetobacteraceae bacterium]